MGASGSKNQEETEDIINGEKEAKEEKDVKNDEEDEDILDDPLHKIIHMLKKANPDAAAIRELCNKEGEAKVDLNTPDLPPEIDPNADPNDPHIIRLKERISKKTYIGDYPLHLLVGRPSTENTPELLDLVKLFFLKEHAMNCRNKLGSTPLHRACAAGNVQMARELINWGAQVDDVNDMQLSCLHMACYAGHTEVVKLLLEKGCAKHIQFKCRYGVAPMDYVLKDDIYELLKAARASKARAGSGAGASTSSSSSSGSSGAAIEKTPSVGAAAAAALIRGASSDTNRVVEGDEEKGDDQ